MSRTSRVYVQGLSQLIQLKGHNQQSVFIDDEDCSVFLNCLGDALGKYSCELHAFTFLPQQVIFLLTPHTKEGLSALIQHIGRSYVPYFNQKYHRSGNLWEGRYHSCVVESDAYLLIAQHYVDSCARRAEVITQAGTERSSYRHNVGESCLTILTAHEQYLRLGKTPAERARQYRRFIQSPLGPAVEKRIQRCLSQNRVLGTPQYCQQLERQLHRSVRPRQCGRPRKHYHNEVTDWVWLESQAAYLLGQYCYQEVRLPLLEQEDEPHGAALFHRQQPDIPRCGHHQLLLRGEGTMGCLRLINQHPALQSTSKLWYQGVMFRSAVRQEQQIEPYHQIGVEAFGYADIDIELEQLAMQYNFFKCLGLKEHVELRLNTVGTAAEFAAFRAALRHYYQPFITVFEPQWLEWLADKPETLLKSDHPLLHALQAGAPELAAFLSHETCQRFNALTSALSRINLPCAVDRALYPANTYCHTLLEWHSDSLEDASLLCRGGRYDSSASLLLERPIYACGFALMLEPIMRLLRLTDKYLLKQQVMDVIIIPQTPAACEEALKMGRTLRKTFPQLSITNDFSRMRIKTCMRNALRRGGRFIIVVPLSPDAAELEIHDRESGEEHRVSFSKVLGMLSHSLNSASI